MGLPPRRIGRLIWPGLALLAGLVVALPLLLRPLPATHDGLHHLFRLFQLDQALRSFHLYPRLFADMGFGYGYPVLNYYSPFAYYIAWIATALGSGYIGGLRVAHVLGLILGALAMYGWVRQSLSRPAAFLAAVAYSAFPYRIADVYVRGALAESLAFVWPPLMLCLGTLIVRRRRSRYVPALALATAAFILTHNLTAFMFAPLLALYLALEAGWPSRCARKAYLDLGASALLGVAISAFFWLPALSELGYVLAGQVGREAGLTEQLQPLTQWLSPFLRHRYFPDQGVAAQHPFGLVQVVLVLTGTTAFLARRRSLTGPTRRVLWLALGATLAGTALLLPMAAPAWDRLPLLPYLQFPWRLQAVLTLTTAVLAAANALWFGEGRLGRPAVIGAALVILASGLSGLTLEPAHMPGRVEPLQEADVSQPGLVEYDFQTALWLREHGGEWLLEYLPRWALGHRTDFFLPSTTEPIETHGGHIDTARVHSYGPLAADVTVTLSAPGPLVWHRFYFPGWRASVDGTPTPLHPAGPLGLLALDLPSGEHRVTLSYGLTNAAAWGALVALVALAGAIAWSAAARSRLPLVLAVLAALGLALVGWRAHSYPSTQYPAPVDAVLDDSVRLLAYQVTPHGGQLEVAIYWMALRAPEEDYRVFVHAVGADGALLAQHDGQPGMEFSPTTRWMAGELVVDRHYLEQPSAPVALFAGMYTLPDVTNLPARQDGVEVPERRVLLGKWGEP